MQGLRQAVVTVWAEGASAPEIARCLGVAPPTVDYHLQRLRGQVEPRPARPAQPPSPIKRQVSTRGEVAALLAAGLGRTQIARELGISKATVSYHARRLGSEVDARCARRYDWKVIQSWYDDGHSVRECMEEFGFTSSSWSHAVKRGAVRPRPNGMPIHQLLRDGTHRGRYNLKVRLVGAGLKDKRCERCGLNTWRGEPITLALHHINGDRHDNRLENLQLLCPNCHSQTDTFAGRNGRGRSRT